MKLYKIDEVCELQSGLWTGKKGPYKIVKVLRNTNFTKDNKLNLENIAEIKVEVNQFEKRVLQKGDILIEKSGGGPNQPVGRVVLIDKRAVGYSFSNFTSRIRVSSDDLNPNYLYWFLNYIYLSGKTENLQRRSTGIRNLQLKEYKELVIPVPSLQEQEKIVERLDKILGNIDKLIKTNLNLIQKNDDLYFTKLNQILKSNTIQDTVELETIAKIYSGNSINEKIKKEEYTNKNFPTPYVATKDLDKKGFFNYENGISIPESDLDKFKIAPKGATLICLEGGSAGKKIGIVQQDVCFVNKLGALVPNEKIKSRYLYYSLQTTEFQKQFKSSLTGIIGGVSLNKLKKLMISTHPIIEQNIIVKNLDSFFELKEKFANHKQKQIVNYLNLQKSILNKEFSYE